MISTDAARDERKAISDLRTAYAQFRSTVQDIKCRMASQGNREAVQELLDDLTDDCPSFDGMMEHLDLVKNG